jgi:hypothetical protein
MMSDDALIERVAEALPLYLRGDGPCADCGTDENIIWHTDSVFWNQVMGPDDRYAILCVACFVKRTWAAGFLPTGWRLTPEWPEKRWFKAEANEEVQP